VTRFAPLWLQAQSYAAGVDRRLIGALWPAARSTGGAVTASTGMSVQAAAGSVAVPAANGTGSALCVWDAPETVNLTPSPPSGSNRIDTIICQSRGQDLDGGANDDFLITAVAGTAATTPVAPTVPAGAVALADVYVGGGVASIVAGNITDRRPGNLAVPIVAVPPTLVSTRAHLGTGVSVPPSTWTQMAVNTLQHNQGGGTWAGGRFTIPRRGLYLLTGGIGWFVSGTTYASSQREFIGSINVDGAGWASQTLNPNVLTVGTGQWWTNMSTVMLLTAGQLVDVRAWHNGPVAYTANAGANTFVGITELPGAV